MSVPDKLAAEVLAKCARHCCICRRFRPLHLQVHHIIERCDGGTDDFDNLIPICVTCHSDVHTATQLTRRFSVQEIKYHRNAVYSLVAEGKLPAGESPAGEAVDAIAARIIAQIRAVEQQAPSSLELPSETLDILMAAVCEDALIKLRFDRTGHCIEVGHRAFYGKDTADPPVVLKPLLERKLLSPQGDEYAVTDSGLALVDTLVNSKARITLTKVKCLRCSLHFTLFTWYPDRHNVANLTCPECGQHNASFLLWQQQEFGFIFEHVPGNAQVLQLGRVDK